MMDSYGWFVSIWILVVKLFKTFPYLTICESEVESVEDAVFLCDQFGLVLILSSYFLENMDIEEWWKSLMKINDIIWM